MNQTFSLSKKLLIATAFILFFINTTLLGQTWSYRAGYGGTSGSEKAGGVCTDASGNVYITGGYATTAVDFGNGTALTPAGAIEGFVAKYNSSGTCQWSLRFGGTGNDQGTGITTDGTNVYVCGNFVSSMTVGGSATAYTSAGVQDGFIMSLSASTGATNWVTTFGGTSTDNAQAICMDLSSNIYVSGNFFSTSATFGSTTLNTTGGSGSDLFVTKCNSSGAIQWANGGGSSASNDNPAGSGICYVPSLNEVVVTGGTVGSGTNTYGSVSLATSGGAGNDATLLEVNASTGAFLSGFIVGGSSNNEEALAACYDSNTGDVFLCGYFQSSSITFGSNTISSSGSAGSDEIFYSRYNPSTNTFTWAKSAGSANSGTTERARAICSNTTGGIIMTGVTAVGTASFPSSPSALTLTDSRTSGGQLFVVQVSAASGNAAWVTNGTGDNTTATDHSGYAVTALSSGVIWVEGLYTTNLTLGSLSALASNTNTTDVLLGKFTAPPPLTATQSQVNLTCNGVCTGQATVVASGGTAPYTYAWSPSGGSGATASSLCAINYTCTITDAASSSITKTFSITQPSAITTTPISQTNVSCNGGSNGAAQMSASGGTGTLTYNWTPGSPTGDGTGSVSGLSSQVWTCTVTDANSCTATRTFNITQPTAITSSLVSQTNVSCNGGSNGAASITASGGTSGYTYDWTPGNPTGDGTTSVTGLSAQGYTCTITDANGCTKTQTVTITAPSAISSSMVSQTNVACNGGSNGAATITASGGTGSLTYAWSPAPGAGQGTTSISGLSAQGYTCTITDANSCTKTQAVTITAPSAISSSIVSQTNVACNGGSTGAASITTSGGAGGNTYAWSPAPGSGQGTTSVSGLSAQGYTCTITDANSCTKTQAVTITAPSAISSSIVSQTNVSCNGGSNGAATITASGGAGSFTYSWAPAPGAGQGTTSISGLSAQGYTCTITDANSCTKTQAVTITAPSAISSSIVSQTNVACNGGSNGAATITTSGGGGANTYAWSPTPGSGQGTTSVSGLSAQGYTCTITDINGCTKTQAVTITAPSAISSSIVSQTNVACNGGSNGAATITASGGTGSLTYAWSPAPGAGQGTASISGLSAQGYTCTITDANSCTKTQAVTITAPSAITSNIFSQTNVSCYGGSNGAATITASGGTGSLTYAWSPAPGAGQGTASISGLSAQGYTCTITDANSCTKTQAVTITAPSAITSNLFSQTNVSCNGGSNGAATITTSGGGGANTYAWSPAPGSGQGTTSVSGLSAQGYTCTITDANGCTKTQAVTITAPSAITSNIVSQTNVSCNGGSNGAASITASGGTSGYTYDWTPGNPTGDGTTSVTGLSAQGYTCTITDANGCTKTQAVTITAPSAISSSMVSQTNVACNGGSNGAATITASGGTGSLTYAWSPAPGAGQGTASISGLTAQGYTCTITDANSCTKTQAVTITAPSAISVTLVSQTNVACNGGSSGAASVSASGGTGTLTYNWNPGNPTGDGTASVTGLVAGNYSCTVTDANSCTATSTIFNITQPSALTATTTQTNVACFGNATGAASVNASGGTGSYTYTWSPSGGNAATAGSLISGNYTCTITDANSCSITKTFTVTQPSSGLSATTTQTNVACNGGNTAIASVSASGGTGSLNYTWTPSGGNASTASGLAAGNYTCTITDASSCSSIKTFTITEPAVLSTISSAGSVLCNGGTTTVTVSATGGTPAYTGTGTFTVGAGTYSYTVTDVNSCSATTTITINEPTALSVSSTAGSISCNGGATTVTVSASGGTAAYTGTGTFTVTAGTYSYTVTDANSCSSTTTVTISEPGLLAATAASGTIACSGGVTTVTVSATGGTPSYSGTGTFTATASASQYTYTVSDANGCTTDAYVTVTEPSPLVITANAASINCNGAATTVSVSASGGTPAYTGLGTFTATAGSYTYTVTDANSCSTSTVITINEPAAIMTTQSPTLCAGQTITVGSNTYSTSATYTDVLTAVNGCDSTVITNLTVNSPIDISTTSSGPTVSSNANGATYQWIDCDNGNAVMPGETNQTFTATVTGNYAVIITENGCSATSACVSVNITGVAAISFESTLSVYPNPFTNEFTITGNVKGTAVLYSLLGEKINEFTLEDKTQVINVSDLAPGIYYLQAGTKKIKIIKQ